LAEDLAMGCYMIAKNKASGIFNISGRELMTPFEMAMETCDYFHLDKSLITKASAKTFSQPAKRPPRTGFDISKAEKELGYKPHSFAEGIRILAGQMDA
jgi:dTDP-4-dehydrorhamnose reductase